MSGVLLWHLAVAWGALNLRKYLASIHRLGIPAMHDINPSSCAGVTEDLS